MQARNKSAAGTLEDWRALYDSKLIAAAGAVKCVHSGNRVAVALGYGEPEHVVASLVARADELENVEIINNVTFSKGDYALPKYAKSFRVNTFFAGVGLRAAFQEHRADHTPCHLSETARLLTEGDMPVDMLLLQCTPPDENGYCSYGLSVGYTPDVVESSGALIIAQCNRLVPWTYPRTLHVSQMDYIVEYDQPLVEQRGPAISELDRIVGAYIAELIPDGATLQLGIGGLPDAVLGLLRNKKELGIHSEALGDTIVDMVEAGVITGSRKTIDKGKMTATFLMGTQKLWSFANRNPMVNMMPVTYTNDPFIIGQFDNLISINSALQVDLTGQVNAETIGPVQYSGVGGQVDFVRGARRSKGGKSIIALPSTAARGTLSRIVLDLSTGGVVTTGRTDVHYIVTEYGVANLRGKSVRQRAKALIGISHPDFRETLTAEAAKRGLL